MAQLGQFGPLELGAVPGGGGSGVLWSLASEDLNANLVELEPDGAIGAHTNAEVDVLVHVLSGELVAAVDGARHDLRPGTVLLVPKGAARAFTAGPAGARDLTVHRRRGALTVGPPRPREPSGQ